MIEIIVFISAFAAVCCTAQLGLLVLEAYVKKIALDGTFFLIGAAASWATLATCFFLK